MRRIVRGFAVLFTLATVMSVAGCDGAPFSKTTAQSSSLTALTITSSSITHQFDVEIARAPDDQARGLMFRTAVPPFGGMLFPLSPPREASFWMKNTVIPLDMIFIRADGTIARIAAETIPYSLEYESSGEPVAAVLEIAGGRASALGISEDDKVSWNDAQN